MTDEQRIDWLEQHSTLHQSVETLYVVTGYEITLLYDEDPQYTATGETYRKALDTLIYIVG